ncbi:error-prone DNA polymerase [Solilutibacter tolerans]|uniref:Error-prone DNA polymerase n=1 Tax=Solilutibacter tolerans TaxID=1604334 RepID=A0A1N6N327_9GAMM|nr:error-prone DNA polymerase [Lysobacter tolerans]SIP86484.1 error-prone DNA polymerase [Lysobacter tolerans]
MSLSDYAELHCLSAFSFQRGASSANELFARAVKLGYKALAITDECSLAGIVRAFEASRKYEVPLIVGAEFQIKDGPKIVLLCESIAGYQALCQLITVSRRRAKKGQYLTLTSDFSEPMPGLLCLLIEPSPDADQDIDWLKTCFENRLWLAVPQHRQAGDAARYAQRLHWSRTHNLSMVATGDVHMHVRGRRALQDTMTAIRHRCTVAEAGWRLFQNGERHLRTRSILAERYPALLLAETISIAARCSFTLDQLQYTYPKELVPDGHTPTTWLRHLTEEGARWRWPNGVTERVRAQIEHELSLIAELKFESYFLTVQDIVRFARSRGILCQGRGSAANSAVCFAVGVTEVDPARINLLFERFLSRERNEPPDIDIDFEHERREEVIQYIFERYGRERAALTAVATEYKGRSAIRDVAKALGLPPDQVNTLAGTMNYWEGEPVDTHLREAGFDPDTPIMRRVIALTRELLRMPRHLSQHPGGFVISDAPLHTLVPVENAAMADRTVIQWDKDDLDTLGLLKVDCLALGMLTAVRKTMELLRDTGRQDLALATIPAEDPATYDMICQADTLGVFQIESRAQMSMLPRIQPRCFYDLVIEVAIVRPGPIQGDMVHPYLRRRRGEEVVDYPPQLKHIFERTLGVPLFQEQVMQLAIDAAGFTPGEADQLRRSMAAWKRRGGLEPHRDKLLVGMLERGYSTDYAETLFERIKGFGHYGFPESHAASFALITYASCWLKCHEPAAFAVSLINSMPLGFYTPDQIIQDARRHGIGVRPVDVRYSDWDCTLEFPRGDASGNPEIRLGLRLIKGFKGDMAEQLLAARGRQPFIDVADMSQRSQMDRRHQGLLADAGALKALAGHRHKARWAVSGVEASLPLFDTTRATPETQIRIPMPSVGEDMVADYSSVGMTLGQHPISLIRGQLRERRCVRSSELVKLPHGRRIRFAGLVRLRQRPETAGGVTFLTLEDEDGMVNAVVWQHTAERQRHVLLDSQLMGIEARLERVDGVQHLIVQRMEDYGALLSGVRMPSRDFH